MKKLIALSVFFVPFLASAQQIVNDKTLVAKAVSIGNTVITILISFAVIYIIFNVVRFLIAGADDPEKRATGRQGVLWGVIGLAIILSIWGLVAILTNTFNTETRPPTEKFPQVNVLVP